MSVTSNRSQVRRLGTQRVFCLETDWWNEVRRPSTIRPALEMVGQVYKPFSFIHKSVATSAEFKHWLAVWAQRRHRDHPLLYLGFHGEPQLLFIGDMRRADGRISLDELAELLANRCAGRMIHFAGCQTFDCDLRHLKRFVRVTGAAAVSGYREYVDWLDSSIFEVQMVGALQRYTVTRQGLNALRETIDRIGKIADALGFRMITKWD